MGTILSVGSPMALRGPGCLGWDSSRQSRRIESRETLVPSQDPEIPELNPTRDHHPESPANGETLDIKKPKESRIPKEPENGDYMSWDSNIIHKINHKIFLLMLIGGFLLIPRVFLNKRLLAQSGGERDVWNSGFGFVHSPMGRWSNNKH